MQKNLITSTRQVPPGETLAAIGPFLSEYDILGFADHTPPGLSLIRSTEIFRGRPRSGFLNLGKGFGLEAALASGYMEAIEMSTIERAPDVPAFRACDLAEDALVYAGLDRKVECARSLEDTRGLVLRGRDLLKACDVYGLCDEIHLPDADAENFCFSTTGLASGNTLAEAQLHAVYELVERHVSFVAAYRTRDVARAELDTPPAALAEALQELQGAGFGCEFFELGRMFGIQVFQCALVSAPSSPCDPSQVNFGWGAHHSPAIAVSRALSEAVQAYATRRACRFGAIPKSRMAGGLLISGEELAGLRAASSLDEHILHSRLSSSTRKTIPLDTFKDAVTPAEEALERVVALMRLNDISHLLCWVLSPEERPFSVVKCAVPEFRSLVP